MQFLGCGSHISTEVREGPFVCGWIEGLVGYGLACEQLDRPPSRLRHQSVTAPEACLPIDVRLKGAVVNGSEWSLTRLGSAGAVAAQP